MTPKRERGKEGGWLLGAVLLACASAAGCSLYDDTGSPDPGASYWPWVCADGSPAPEAGCPEEDAGDGGGQASDDGG